MRLWVPVHVKTISSVLPEKQLFKVCLEFDLGKDGEHGNVSLLSIKLITVSSELKVPEALELLTQVPIFLWDCSLDCIDNCRELFISHISDLGPHLSQMDIKSLTNVQAVPRWWLNEEPAADDVAGATRAGKNNVA